MTHNAQSDHMKQTYAIARIFIIAVIVVTVLNGSSFWLKRVGWLEPQLSQYYNNKGYRDMDIIRGSEDFKQLTRDTYQTKCVWTAFKASKDMYFFLFFIVSLLLILRGYTEWEIRYVWLFSPMAFLFLYASCKSLLESGPLLLLAGIRSFLVLGVVIVGPWIAREKEFYFLTKCFIALILFQLLLSPYEFYMVCVFLSVHISGIALSALCYSPAVLGLS